MKTVFIGGYYGAGNLGDEAILDSMLRDLRALRSDLSFIVTSWNPEATSRQFDVESVFWKDVPGIISAGQKSDLVLLGGGGLFQDYWGIQPDTYLRRSAHDITAYGGLPLLARLLDIPCMIYAMGLGPLQSETALQHTRLAFENCQIATLRDSESMDLLRKTGFEFNKSGGPLIEQLTDPVFSLETSAEDESQVEDFLKQYQSDDQSELICVSLRYWEKAGTLENWLPAIAQGLNQFLEKNHHAQVLLIPFQAQDDSPFTNDLAVIKHLYQFMSESWRVHIVEELLTPRFVQALFKRSSVILGMRLHALILGMNVGTPVVALPYDPKVSSLMKQAGLDAYCCDSISPRPQDLAAILENAVRNRAELQADLLSLRIERSKLARKNASLAISLLDEKTRSPLRFDQQFAIEQLLLLEKTDHELEQSRMENEQLQVRAADLESRSSELNEIKSSKFWKIAKLYYRLVQDSPLRYAYQFLGVLKREGLSGAFRKIAQAIKARLLKSKSAYPVTYVDESTLNPLATIQNIVRALNERSLKGVFVVTSAFVFDELYNQRIINLSKFLADEKWGVIYVAWRWSKNETMMGVGQEVYKNIFQIPVDMFLENLLEMSGVVSARKYFAVEFPHPEFLAAALRLRKYNFKILYEIIDEWEEFNKVGQAIWYNKSVEQALVINANILTAVSPPLVEKFSILRKDIHLNPNGYTPSMLGLKQRGVAGKKVKTGEFHLGYFGHLTESWFDWDFLFSILERAERENLKLHLHLIGYGEPDLRERLEQYKGRLTFYGKVQPSELWQYARNWDAALICFKTGPLSEAVDPIKIYEYAYFGLPVMAKGIGHLSTFPSAYMINDETQFVDAVHAIQAGGHKKTKIQKDVDALLARSTWNRRFTDLLEILERNEWMFL